MKKTLKNIVCLLFLFLAFSLNINAQQGFRIETNAGVTVGDAKDFFHYTLQGNIYYLWNVDQNIDLGLTTGALVFLGDAAEDYCIGCMYDDYEPELYIPIAIAGRVNLSNRFAVGLDLGYAYFVHIFYSGGGFYLRPVINYNFNKKLALTGSYLNINESGFNSSSVNLGVNFGF